MDKELLLYNMIKITKYTLIVYIIYHLFFVSKIFATQTEKDVIGDTLCNVVNLVSGQIARGIATLAIFAVGIGLFLGKINWGLAATTAAAVAVIFGAGDLVEFIAPDNLLGEGC